MNLPMIGILVLTALLSALGQILFKYGAVGRISFQEFVNPWVFSGLVCYGCAAVLWIYCLSKISLLLAYPFTTLGFILTIMAGTFLFGETASTTYWLGLIFILLGLFLVSV